MVGARDRRAEGRFEFRLVREPLSHLLGRAVEHFQERDLVLDRVVGRLGLGEQVVGEEVVDRLGLAASAASALSLGRDRLVALGRLRRSAATAFSRSASALAALSARPVGALVARIRPKVVPAIPPSSASSTRLAAITGPLFRLRNLLKR